MQVFAREVVSIIGTKDQGKSTLVRIAAGFERPDRGSVHVGGLALAGLKDKEHADVLRWWVGLAETSGPGTQPKIGEYVALRLKAGQGFSRRERRYDGRRGVGASGCR